MFTAGAIFYGGLFSRLSRKNDPWVFFFRKIQLFSTARWVIILRRKKDPRSLFYRGSLFFITTFLGMGDGGILGIIISLVKIGKTLRYYLTFCIFYRKWQFNILFFIVVFSNNSSPYTPYQTKLLLHVWSISERIYVLNFINSMHLSYNRSWPWSSLFYILINSLYLNCVHIRCFNIITVTFGIYNSRK